MREQVPRHVDNRLGQRVETTLGARRECRHGHLKRRQLAHGRCEGTQVLAGRLIQAAVLGLPVRRESLNPARLPGEEGVE